MNFPTIPREPPPRRPARRRFFFHLAAFLLAVPAAMVHVPWLALNMAGVAGRVRAVQRWVRIRSQVVSWLRCSARSLAICSWARRVSGLAGPMTLIVGRGGVLLRFAVSRP